MMDDCRVQSAGSGSWYATCGTDKIKGLAQGANSGILAVLRFQPSTVWSITPSLTFWTTTSYTEKKATDAQLMESKTKSSAIRWLLKGEICTAELPVYWFLPQSCRSQSSEAGRFVWVCWCITDRLKLIHEAHLSSIRSTALSTTRLPEVRQTLCFMLIPAISGEPHKSARAVLHTHHSLSSHSVQMCVYLF